MSSDSNKWVILELSWSGEQKNEKELEDLLSDQIEKDVEFFIPSTTFSKNEDHVTVSLMEGYVFAEGGYSPSTYFKMEEFSCISKVLTRKSSSNRHLLYADQEEIENLRGQLREETVKKIEEGDEVRITEGVWENLEGEVIGKADPEDIEDEELKKYENHIYVDIRDLESIDSIVTLPKAFLKKI